MPGASSKLRIPNHNIEKKKKKRRKVPCPKYVCPSMCGRETAAAHVHWGDAKGHHSGGQIPLKWHLKQTSSDKVVPFLCP